jgi:hypothetical protein
MTGRTDRRLIAPLMVPYFPTMADPKLTSDDWHGFMNAMTGLDVDPDEDNATAFDKWRQALSEQKDLPVWRYTPTQTAKMKERGEELKRLEEARGRAEPERLKKLAELAPTKTVGQLIKDAKEAVKKWQ